MEINLDNVISIIMALLLFVSESLPFVKNLDSNGIFHSLILIGNDIISRNSNQPIFNRLSTEPDIEQATNSNKQLDDIYSNTSSLKEFIESKKFQHPTFYELEYIKNYIRANFSDYYMDITNISEDNKTILQNLTYRIEYDSINKRYTIRW